MKSFHTVDLIGNTPLIELTAQSSGVINEAQVYAKCEFLNPGSSMKDRIAKYIIETAESEGVLRRGDTIVCSSSGNTGCSFAMLGALKGYSVIVITSKKCSLEKQNHIRALNAELIVVDEHSDYMEYGNKLSREKGYFNVDQYNNPRNPEAYYRSLGPEIWKGTEGQVTHFVMTGSTFGCICGTGKFLKEKNPNIQVILADPLGSNIYNYYHQSSLGMIPEHSAMSSIIEGAGKDKPTGCLDFSIIDEVVQVADKDAVMACHRLSQRNGVLVGGSSGINVFAAMMIASKLSRENVVATILCDSGIKYLSKIYNHDFLSKNLPHKEQLLFQERRQEILNH